jgi:hypothetical protein
MTSNAGYQQDRSAGDEVLRIFTREMKKECWKRARHVPGRDPDRWRLDAVGNVVCAKLTSCEGCLCHEYDHITPFSKGGGTTVENCQILQTRVNRLKGNQDNNPDIMRGYGCQHAFTIEELDGVELAVYGDIQRNDRRCRSPSIYEQWNQFVNAASKKPFRAANLPPCDA